jgi:hypothetical protein
MIFILDIEKGQSIQGFKKQGAGYRVQGLKKRVQGAGFRVRNKQTDKPALRHTG